MIYNTKIFSFQEITLGPYSSTGTTCNDGMREVNIVKITNISSTTNSFSNIYTKTQSNCYIDPTELNLPYLFGFFFFEFFLSIYII
jgi:hypothetical protein